MFFPGAPFGASKAASSSKWVNGMLREKKRKKWRNACVRKYNVVSQARAHKAVRRSPRVANNELQLVYADYSSNSLFSNIVCTRFGHEITFMIFFAVHRANINTALNCSHLSREHQPFKPSVTFISPLGGLLNDSAGSIKYRETGLGLFNNEIVSNNADISNKAGLINGFQT